jgi:cobalt-zinc-cadmium efflux system outer membrane protein
LSNQSSSTLAVTPVELAIATTQRADFQPTIDASTSSSVRFNNVQPTLNEPAFVQPATAVSHIPEVARLPATVESLPDPGHSLSLNAALRTALAQNPDLVALRQTEAVSRAAYGVARTYPYNPYVQVEVLPYARESNGETGSTVNYVLLMQQFELAHQGRYREQTGLALLSRTDANIVQAEVLAVAETERRFFTALYQKRLFELASDVERLNAQLEGVTQRRFETGTATAADLAMTRIETRSARQQARTAALAYQTALLNLRTQLGLQTPENVALDGDLESFVWLPANPALGPCMPTNAEAAVGATTTTAPDYQQWSDHRGDVLAAIADVRAAEAQVRLARASRVPDVQIGPFYERDESATVFLGFRSQMSLPVVNTGMPLVQQRCAELIQRRTTLEQLRTRARLEVQAAFERYSLAREQVEEFRDQVIPGLDPELRSVEDLFEAGQVDLLRVYAARTRTLQVRKTYADAVNELAQAAANLTSMAGMNPDAIVKLPPRPPMLQ